MFTITYEAGRQYKQIKNVGGYPYNRVNELWDIHEITTTHVILKNGYLGFGIEHEKFNEYFEEYQENKNNHEIRVDGTRVIRNGVATIVILNDGSKGVAKCLPEDEYDPDLGYSIAYTKAKIKSLTKQLKKMSK